MRLAFASECLFYPQERTFERTAQSVENLHKSVHAASSKCIRGLAIIGNSDRIID
jgi:hypothetical protein